MGKFVPIRYRGFGVLYQMGLGVCFVLIILFVHIFIRGEIRELLIILIN